MAAIDPGQYEPNF